MRPQPQLIDHCPEEGRYGDCQRTCVAAILDMDAKDVPHFCDPPHAPKGEPGWWEERQNEWLAQFGLATMTVAYSGSQATFDDVMEWTSRQSPTVPMILCGQGAKGVNHVVVVLNGEIVCDPSGSGIIGPTLENTWEVQVLAANAASTREDELLEALTRARTIIQDERDAMVECATSPPEHDLATLDPFTKPYVENYDRELAAIDAALAKARGEQ